VDGAARPAAGRTAGTPPGRRGHAGPDEAAADLEHLQRVRSQVVRARGRGIGGDGRAPVGAHGQQPPAGPAQGEDPLHELAVVRSAGEPQRHRRHLQHHVGGQQPGQAGHVGRLERGDVTLDHRVLVGVGRFPEPVQLRPGGPQRRPGPLQAAVDRGHAAVQRLGDVSGRELEDLAQDQRRTLASRKELERRDQRQPQSGALLGDVRRVAQPVVREGLQPRDVGVGHQRCPWIVPGGSQPARERPPGSSFQRAEAGVGGDAVQPGAQRGPLRVVPVGRPPGPQQRLLDQVLGLVERAEHPVAVRQQVAAEGLVPRVPVVRRPGHPAKRTPGNSRTGER